MKTIKYFVFIGVLAVISFACSLEPEIYSEISQEEFENNPEIAFKAKLGEVYTNLQREYGYVYREGLWSLQENTTDECLVPTRKSGDWYDGGIFHILHNHQFNAQMREVANNGASGYNAWNFCYTGITKINLMLQWMDKVGAVYPRERAELKTFRAFYHYLLLENFGNVAFVTHAGDGYEPVQRQRAVVFDSIMTELNTYVPQLSPEKLYARVNKNVGWMILAKMYLNAESWGVIGQAKTITTAADCYQKAANYCDSIIANGGYRLEDNYFTNFRVDNENSRENMWCVVYDQIYSKGMQFHMMTLHYASMESFGLKYKPWNGYCTSHKFLGIYEPNDVRFNSWLRGQQYAKNGSKLTATVAVDSASWVNMPEYVRKPANYPAERPKGASENGGVAEAFTVDFDAYFTDTITTVTNTSKYDIYNVFEGARFQKFQYQEGVGDHMNNDFPIFRYADVLLMKAEALMRLNNGVATQPAVDVANEVRDRANATPYSTTTLTLDELLMERGRELCWEGFRRQDLIRFGRFTGPNSVPNESDPYNLWILKQTVDGQQIGATEEYKKIFPIPEFKITDGFTPNPGYN